MKIHAALKWAVVVMAGLGAGYVLSACTAGAPGASQKTDDAGKTWRPVWETPVPEVTLSGPFTSWPNQPASTTHWSLEDIEKAHVMLAGAERAGDRPDPNSALHDFPYWTRTHAMFIKHVPQRSATALAEQHLGYGQFIVVMGGEGSVVAGGELRQAATLVEQGRQIPGELRGPSIRDGETFQLGSGDVLSIPPNTPALFTANSPGGLSYMVLKVNAMLYPWELIR